MRFSELFHPGLDLRQRRFLLKCRSGQPVSPSVSEIGERTNSNHALGHDDPVYEAVMEMNAGHYRAAQSILDDVQCTTSESNPRYDEIMDDVDYLYALCNLGRGSRTKAYRQLKAISTSDSRHARQAAELIKHFK